MQIKYTSKGIQHTPKKRVYVKLKNVFGRKCVSFTYIFYIYAKINT